MKTFINSFKLGIFTILLSFITSCNEKEFLNEVPKDFYSPENSFVTYNDFQSALTYLYAKVRYIHCEGSNNSYSNFLGTDIIMNGRQNTEHLGDYNVWVIPTHAMIEYIWVSWYTVISNSNVILSRLKDSQLSEDQKKLVAAEAKFFRAFAYRYLVYLYGGVPLVVDEVLSPKTDYTRATKDDVLNQIVADASEAAANLPSIDKVDDGRVSNLVAQHLLAETYVALGKYTEAIAAASVVINDPNMALMTARFGKRISVVPGDVFWDLFQRGNQNRKSSGNKEALWVLQMEIDVTGGLLSSSEQLGNPLERFAVPVGGSLAFKDPAGKEGMLAKPISDLNIGGRGVSFMRNTDYWINTLWQSDFDNDIRNAPYNIIRDCKYNNPASAYYNKSIVTFPSPTWKAQTWRWYPWPSKVTTPGDHPDNLYEDKSRLILKASSGSTYSDQYLLRLPETYLLRSEAYLASGDKANAAKDINVVRARANAKPVNVSDVTLDYILDERARELVYEEQRRITLGRTGTLVERVRKYNEWNGDEIKDYNNLWPIPYSEIEANKDAVLEQNPGYVQ